MLETGTRISHEAVKLAARVGCLLLWVGDGGVRLYAAGQPGGYRSDRLLFQAKVALDEKGRLQVVRAMYRDRFGENAPLHRSIEQLRGLEGARVRRLYGIIAKQYGLSWKGRSYDPSRWDKADPLNKALSAATASLYGVCEAAILAAGYSPAIGFVHSGKPQSFVYDIADLFKFETVIPIAFHVASKQPSQIERSVRIACRNAFRKVGLLKRVIPKIEEMLEASGLERPRKAPETVPIAIPNEEGLGDAGHSH